MYTVDAIRLLSTLPRSAMHWRREWKRWARSSPKSEVRYGYWWPFTAQGRTTLHLAEGLRPKSIQKPWKKRYQITSFPLSVEVYLPLEDLKEMWKAATCSDLQRQICFWRHPAFWISKSCWVRLRQPIEIAWHLQYTELPLKLHGSNFVWVEQFDPLGPWLQSEVVRAFQAAISWMSSISSIVA